MAWNPQPTDPIHAWKSYQICILLQADNGVGMPEVTLLYRPLGDPSPTINPWNSMGNSDGTVWAAQNWEADVAAKGGFKAWWANLLVLINARIQTWATALNPPAPVGDPKTFAEFQAWIRPITWLDSDTTTVATKP